MNYRFNWIILTNLRNPDNRNLNADLGGYLIKFSEFSAVCLQPAISYLPFILFIIIMYNTIKVSCQRQTTMQILMLCVIRINLQLAAAVKCDVFTASWISLHFLDLPARYFMTTFTFALFII